MIYIVLFQVLQEVAKPPHFLINKYTFDDSSGRGMQVISGTLLGRASVWSGSTSCESLGAKRTESRKM